MDPLCNAIGECGDADAAKYSKRNDRTDEPSPFSFGTSDEEFHDWIALQLLGNPLANDYPDLFQKAPLCITNWRRRYRGNVALWKRIFDKDRVLKEFSEAVPVLDAVYRMILAASDDDEVTAASKTSKQYTIIDLCSGKGYLSMILSELLPPEKVFRIILMDKAWPMRNQQPQKHHINWDHIYGESTLTTATATAGGSTTTTTDDREHKHHDDEGQQTTKGSSYYDTWPIPLDTSKQDLKNQRQLRNIRHHYLDNPDQHPVIILAIHLCGTLSLRAVQLFNDNPDSVRFLALKPCCLPGMIHAKRHEVFDIGKHSFEAKDVCIHGSWKKNQWKRGPPRRHLKERFQRWADHLYCGILDHDSDSQDSNDHDKTKNKDSGKDAEIPSSVKQKICQNEDRPVPPPPVTIPTKKMHCRIMVQQDGGFQNDFLFAQRMPITDLIWKKLESKQVTSTERNGTSSSSALTTSATMSSSRSEAVHSKNSLNTPSRSSPLEKCSFVCHIFIFPLSLLYLFWVFVPDDMPEPSNIPRGILDFLPQKQYGIHLSTSMVLLFFAAPLFYAGLNSFTVPPLESKDNLRDNFTRENTKMLSSGEESNTHSSPCSSGPALPEICDLDPSTLKWFPCK